MAQRCSVCAHPRADALNARLRAPEPPLLPPLAREFGLTRFALMRHRDRHLVEAKTSSATREPVTVAERRVDDDEQDLPVKNHPGQHQGVDPDQLFDSLLDDVPVDRRVPAGKRTMHTPPKQRFLTEYARTGNVSQSAASASVSRRVVYKWQEHDEQFALAFREAENEAIEALEAEARERATTGSKLVRRVFRNGKLIEEIHEFRPSDTVLVKLLQALRPEKYGDKLAISQTTTVKTIDQQAWDSV